VHTVKLEVGLLLSIARIVRVFLLSMIIALLFLLVDMFSLLLPHPGSPAVICGSVYVGGEGGVLYRLPISEYVSRSALLLNIEEPEFFVGMPSRVASLRLLISQIFSDNREEPLKDYRKVVGLEPALKIADLLRQRGLKVALYVDVAHVESFRKSAGKVSFKVERFNAMVGDKIENYCVKMPDSGILEVRDPLTFCGCPSMKEDIRWLSGDDIRGILSDRNTQSRVVRWFISGENLEQIEDALADVGVLIVTPSYYSSFAAYLANIAVLGSVLVGIMWLIYLAVSEFLGTAEIVSHTRRFFVLYTLGRPVRWISFSVVKGRLWELVVALLVAVFFLWFAGPILHRVYMPPNMNTVFYFGNLQSAAGVAAMLDIPSMWGWRIAALMFLIVLVLGVEYITAFVEISRSFFVRGSRVVPVKKMVASVVLLTAVVSVSVAWTLWAGMRLYHAYRLYKVEGFAVADSDFGFLHLRTGLAKSVMTQNGIDGLLVVYSPEDSLVRYCPVGVAGERLWDEIGPHLVFLWGAEAVKLDCSLGYTSKFDVLLFYVDKQQLDKFATAYYQAWKKEIAQSGADLGKGFELDKQVFYMKRSFASVSDLISKSLWKAVMVSLMFCVFAAVAAFALGYAVSELVVVLLPYRVAVFVAFGETVSGAFRRVLRMVVLPVLIGAFVAAILTIVLLFSVWRVMYVRPPFVINLVPLMVVLLIAVFIYIGILLTAAGVKREGVISIMKRDM